MTVKNRDARHRNKIFCYRDAELNTEAMNIDPGVNIDETPRGKRYKVRGGIVTRIILAVDLYFIVPNKLGYYAIMVKLQDHFAKHITQWNDSLEYQKRPLSEATLDESYYKHRLTRLYGDNAKAFAFEISDIDDNQKKFRYHGYYIANAWRNPDGKAMNRPRLPEDWDYSELTELARMITN